MNLTALRDEQSRLAALIHTSEPFTVSPQWVGGADVGFEQGGKVTRAAIVLLEYPSLALVESHVARIPTVMPYIPGFLSFRELPALLEAWGGLSRKPDLLFVDGQGIAHPRRLGVASHFGLAAGVPTIGVAKKRLCGEFPLLGDEPGDCQPLTDKGECLGWVLRSKKRCNPLFISPGQGINSDSALQWTTSCLRGYRLPEPTRFADGIASRRDGFVSPQAIMP